MLGLGRALGETMAVTFVIGNAHQVSASLFAPGTTISASIANEFTEAVGDLYTSSLIALGLHPVRHHLHRAGDRALHAAAPAAAGGLDAMTDIARHRKARSTPAAAGATPSPRTLALAATAFGLGWLVLILGVLLYKGIGGLSLAVFTENTPPPGSAGGLLNAIVGSLIDDRPGRASSARRSASWPAPTWPSTAGTTSSPSSCASSTTSC